MAAGEYLTEEEMKLGRTEGIDLAPPLVLQCKQSHAIFDPARVNHEERKSIATRDERYRRGTSSGV
jgi:hypothetical protein